MELNYFEEVLVTLTKDINLSDEFNPIDEHLFVNTGIYESGEHGEWELCTVKAGSRLYVAMSPAGKFAIMNEGQIHCYIEQTDFTLPPGTKFKKPATLLKNSHP